MHFSSHWWFRIVFLLVLINPRLAAAPLERSVSASRQFVIYGVTAELRGAVADLAEKTKTDLLKVLQQPDDWKTPVILNLQFPQANLPDVPSAALYFSQTGSGLRLQLDLVIHWDVEAEALQRELLRAILLEMEYRREPGLPAGTVYVPPPQWLVEGLLAASSGGRRDPIVSALAAVVASGNAIELEKFLQSQVLSEADSQGRRLYQGYALALLQLILDQPNGSANLAAYVRRLPAASNDPLSDLKTALPLLGHTADIEAIWKSKVKALSAVREFELLAFWETEHRLAQLLAPGILDPASGKRVSLEKVAQKKIARAQVGEIRLLSQRLMQLGAVANPLMRPVVAEYQQIAQLLAAKRRRRLTARLARLGSTRARLIARMSAVDDYMNWFEVTQPNAPSGKFAEYFRAAGKSADKAPRRRDPLSVYLDSLEGQF